MKGRQGRIARRERAIPRIENHILAYEETLVSSAESLMVARKEKNAADIRLHETSIKLCEKRLGAHHLCLENTKKNLNN